MNISKSRIKTLNNCSLLFFWQYIEKRIPDIPPAPITKVGIDIHKIFDDFYQLINIEKVPENPLEYFKKSMTVLPQYQGIFNLFCKFQAKRWQLTENKDNFLPVLREQKIINNDEVGVIDAVHYDGENYVVLDYKSSANNPSNLRFELNYYKKILDDAKILDKPVKYISVYGYRDGNIWFEEVNNRSYSTMLKKVDLFRNTNWETMEYPKKIGFHCQWCSYINSCNKLI